MAQSGLNLSGTSQTQELVSFMIKTHIFAILAAAALFAGLSFTAHAETQTLLVPVDESQILQLPTMPGAIIIGNPAVADVSIQGQKLFVHGRAFGETNLTILDLKGEQVANFKLVGTISQASQVVVFKGATVGPSNRFSYSCTGTCETSLQVGDNTVYFDLVASSTAGKLKLATGNNTAEATAPEAPQ
jgi:Flp pilus assembly secretin CpaC